MRQQIKSLVEWVLALNIGSTFPTVVAGLMAIGFVGWFYVYDLGRSDSNKDVEAQIANWESYQSAHDQCIESSGTIDDFKKCFSGEKQTSASEYRSYEDLNAQREMAYWAEAMLKATLLSVFVTGVGVLYVALTLKEARKTTQAAMDASFAASEMNEIVKKEQRPWISIAIDEKANTYPMRFQNGEGEDQGNGFGIRTIIKLKNSGKVPACNLRIAVELFDKFLPVDSLDGRSGMFWHDNEQQYADIGQKIHIEKRLSFKGPFHEQELVCAPETEITFTDDGFLAQFILPKSDERIPTDEKLLSICVKYSSPLEDRFYSTIAIFRLCVKVAYEMELSLIDDQTVDPQGSNILLRQCHGTMT